MTDFPEKLRIKERVDEDLYFARRDRELIDALHRRRPPALRSLCSGGQTGVDRAALMAVEALPRDAGITATGWCPQGRLAEDGVIDARFALQETPSRDPAQRTEWNVRDSDATLVLHRGALIGGTALAVRCAEQSGRPLLTVDLSRGSSVEAIVGWLRETGAEVLNVAGPRESEAPGITTQSLDLLRRVLLAVVELRRRRAGP
ncbi:MAG: putative molybdenum carrier protein [Thiohalocapsa sp.]|jgi:hypothetical protein